MTQFDIKKIKRDDPSLIIDYMKTEDGHLSTHTSKFNEMARQEFYNAFDALALGFCHGLRLEFSGREKFIGRFYPIGITYGEDKSGCGFASIVCEYRIPATVEKVAIKSPPYRLATTNEEGLVAGYWDFSTSRLLMVLRDEAEMFLSGHRAQGNLFGDEEGKGDPINVTPEDMAPAQIATSARRAGGTVFQLRG